MPVKVVFFNVGGVLLQLHNTTIPKLYAESLTSILNHEVSTEETRNAFQRAQNWVLNRRSPGSLFTDLDQRKYQNAFYNTLGIQNRREINRIEAELAEQIEMEFVLEEGAEEVLKSLKDYELGIISNWGFELREILEDFDILDYFDSVTISDEVGIGKPHLDIFKSALSDFPEIKPKETAYVGDDYQEDIRPAQQLRMLAILYDKGEEGMHGRIAQPQISPRIEKLSELQELLYRTKLKST